MPLPLGVIVSLREEPEASIAHVREFDLPTCQVSCWNLELCRSEVARRLRDAAQGAGVAISTFWGGVPGRRVWDFLEGPTTIGLVAISLFANALAAALRFKVVAAQTGHPVRFRHAMTTVGASTLAGVLFFQFAGN